MKSHKQIAICLLTATALLVACGKKAEKAQETTKQVVVPVTTPKTDWPQDAMLDAMLRGHPNSRKVCQDENRTNAFFADYSHHEDDGGVFTKGWAFIQNVEFYETSNKTLFIIEMEHNRYVRTYPDVLGMKCKER